MKLKHGILFITALIAFGVLPKPSIAQEVKTDIIIKVMTYNVHHCNPPEKTGIIDVDGVAKVIRSHKPDIAAIQEVDVNTNRSGNINEALLLSQKTDLPFYYFGKAMDFDGGQYGVLILSRFPLSDTQIYRLPSAGINKDEPRVVAAATVKLDTDKYIRFGSTHFEAYNKTSRKLQAEEINRLSENFEISFIIAGDFNDTEGIDVLKILDSNFSRTCQQCPSTFWEDGDTGAIDFIFYRPQNSFTVLAHDVVQDKKASDHMPVVVRLKTE